MIKLSLKEKMSFVHSYIEHEIDLGIINEKSNEKFEQSILNEFEDLLKLSKLDNLVNWHKNLNLPNVKLSNLQERIIETPSGKALIGIRFLGMDITKPFVSIWSNFRLEKELDLIIEITKKEYYIFKPKFVRFWTKPNDKLALKHNTHKEQSFYINHIEEICKTHLPANYKRIDLLKAENLFFYDWYKQVYQEFHLENKALKFFVTPSSKKDLEVYLKDGLVYFIVYKDVKIGIISAQEQHFLGEKSLYITEIVILKEYRGKKLATATQRKFIEILKNDYKFVWGMISAKNFPSYKNALRVGRKIISTEILLPIN